MGCAASVLHHKHSSKIAQMPKTTETTLTMQSSTTNPKRDRDVMAEFDKQRRIQEYLDRCVR